MVPWLRLFAGLDRLVVTLAKGDIHTGLAGEAKAGLRTALRRNFPQLDVEVC